MSCSRYVHLDVKEIVRETDKAFLFRLDDDEEVWIPRSQVADADEYAQGDEDCVISVTEWIAEQKELG